MTDKFWRTAAFALSVVCIATGFYALGATASKNTDAIEKSCILLNNAIRQTGAGSSGPTQILIQEILRNAEEDGRKWVRVAYLKAVTQNPPAQQEDLILNCKRIAQDPNSIHELQDAVTPASTPNKEG